MDKGPGANWRKYERNFCRQKPESVEIRSGLGVRAVSLTLGGKFLPVEKVRSENKIRARGRELGLYRRKDSAGRNGAEYGETRIRRCA